MMTSSSYDLLAEYLRRTGRRRGIRRGGIRCSAQTLLLPVLPRLLRVRTKAEQKKRTREGEGIGKQKQKRRKRKRRELGEKPSSFLNGHSFSDSSHGDYHFCSLFKVAFAYCQPAQIARLASSLPNGEHHSAKRKHQSASVAKQFGRGSHLDQSTKSKPR